VKELNGQRTWLGFFDVAKFDVVLLDEHLIGHKFHDRGIWGRLGIQTYGDALDFHTLKITMFANGRRRFFWTFLPPFNKPLRCCETHIFNDLQKFTARKRF
jgi:hypothetical protein